MENHNIPTHVAMIYDGNRRWARAKDLPEFEGHKAGAKNITDNVMYFVRDSGVKYLTLWLFSTENWKREGAEVNFIWGLFRKVFKEFSNKLVEEEIRFRHLGRKDRLPKDVVDAIVKLEEATKDFDKYNLCLALDYGGRDEIVRATRKIIKAGIDPEKLTEEEFSKYLDTAGVPDPDLIIRTSGELRLSGFMPWQGTYAEIYVSDKNGPDLDEAEYKKALESYANRNRRFGGNSKK